MGTSVLKEKHYSFTLKNKKSILLLDTFLKALNVEVHDDVALNREDYKSKLEKSKKSKGRVLSPEEQDELFKL